MVWKETIMRRTRLGWAVWTVVLGLVAEGGLTQVARAEVRLPKVFSSHLVLQQEKPLVVWGWAEPNEKVTVTDRKSTRLNSSHLVISYAVFCLKKQTHH